MLVHNIVSIHRQSYALLDLCFGNESLIVLVLHCLLVCSLWKQILSLLSMIYCSQECHCIVYVELVNNVNADTFIHCLIVFMNC